VSLACALTEHVSGVAQMWLVLTDSPEATKALQSEVSPSPHENLIDTVMLSGWNAAATKV
jgi:hypothetical protein